MVFYSEVPQILLQNLLPRLGQTKQNLAWLIPSISLLLIAGVLIHRTIFHPLAAIPGPRIAAITGLWRTIRYGKGTWHDDCLELHDRYGPVVRIAPNEVSVVDAAAMKQLYGHGKSAMKSCWYHTWHVPGADVMFFAETDPKIHSLKKKRVTSAYSMTAILRYEKYIQGIIDLCLAKIEQFAGTGEAFDITEWVRAFAFDVVGELAFGEQLGHLQTETDVAGLRTGISSAFYLSAVLGHCWGQIRLLMRLFDILHLQSPIAEFIQWTDKKVMARKENPSAAANRHDMLTHFLQMKNLDGTGPARHDEMLVETTNIVAAGADTTSTGILACLRFIGTHPEAYSKLQREIEEFYLANGLQGSITYNQTQQLPYLKAVVTESMRLFPSINFQLPRVSPPAGIAVGKYYIPAGYDIGCSARSQNRDPLVFGKTRNEFRPERWLESPEKTSSMESALFTFGGNGPRACTGKHIALVEIHKFVAQLLHAYDFELVNTQNPWNVSSVWSAHPTNMNVRLYSRDQK